MGVDGKKCVPGVCNCVVGYVSIIPEFERYFSSRLASQNVRMNTIPNINNSIFDSFHDASFNIRFMLKCGQMLRSRAFFIDIFVNVGKRGIQLEVYSLYLVVIS